MREASVDGKRGRDTFPIRGRHVPASLSVETCTFYHRQEVKDARTASPGPRRARRHPSAGGCVRHRADRGERHSTAGTGFPPNGCPLEVGLTARFQDTLRYLDLCQRPSLTTRVQRATERWRALAPSDDCADSTCLRHRNRPGGKSVRRGSRLLIQQQSYRLKKLGKEEETQQNR